MNLKPPRRLRETFQMLSLIDPETGVPGLLDQVDWRGVTPRQIYAAFLDRLPESATVAAVPEEYDPRGHAANALQSAEFRDNVVGRVLAAYAEKTRLISVFVPRTIDAELSARLAAENAWVDKRLGDPDETTTDALMTALRRFALHANVSDDILVSGFSLSHLISCGYYRFGDRLFCLVRHPFEMVLGACNEVFRMLYAAGAGEEPDPELATWVDVIGRDRLEADASRDELRRIGVRLLSAEGRLQGNALCDAIGEGNADSAMELMARCELEIVPIQRYQAWMAEQWRIDVPALPAHLDGPMQMDDLGPRVWRLLSDLCAEDVRLWEKIGQDEARRVKRRAAVSAA